MTLTPIPLPLPSRERYMVTCDGCLTFGKTGISEEIPPDWIKVYIPGWIGHFHACCRKCEKRIILAKS